MFEAIDVWKKKGSDAVVRYRCFRVVESNRYCVQSADFYRLPVLPDHATSLEKQFLELLIEEDPDSRAGTHAALEQAIAAHDEDFEKHI